MLAKSKILLAGSKLDRAVWVMSALGEPALEIVWNKAAHPGENECLNVYDMILVDADDSADEETLSAWVKSGVPVVVLVRETDAVYPFFLLGVDDAVAAPCVHPLDFRARIKARLAERSDRDRMKSRLVQMETMMRAAGAGQIIDPVTGFQAKNRIVEALSSEFSRVERYGAMLTIMFVKIDDLGRFRENGGFLAADCIVAETARIVKRLLRETDIVGRYDDDVFLVLCPHTHASDAAIPAKRMVEAVANASFNVCEEGERLRISAGLAGAPSFGIRTLDGLVQAADMALSDAERLGGVSVYGRSVLGEVAV